MKRQTRPRKFADEPKQIIPLALRPPVLTVKEPPARGWLAKIAVASVVRPAVLVRSSFNLGQRLAFTLHGIAAVAKVPLSRRRHRCRWTRRHLSVPITLRLAQVRKRPLTTRIRGCHCQGWTELPSSSRGSTIN